jgi:hypothetical protein
MVSLKMTSMFLRKHRGVRRSRWALFLSMDLCPWHHKTLCFGLDARDCLGIEFGCLRNDSKMICYYLRLEFCLPLKKQRHDCGVQQQVPTCTVFLHSQPLLSSYFHRRHFSNPSTLGCIAESGWFEPVYLRSM